MTLREELKTLWSNWRKELGAEHLPGLCADFKETVLCLATRLEDGDAGAFPVLVFELYDLERRWLNAVNAGIISKRAPMPAAMIGDMINRITERVNLVLISPPDRRAVDIIVRNLQEEASELVSDDELAMIRERLSSSDAEDVITAVCRVAEIGAFAKASIIPLLLEFMARGSFEVREPEKVPLQEDVRSALEKAVGTQTCCGRPLRFKDMLVSCGKPFVVAVCPKCSREHVIYPPYFVIESYEPVEEMPPPMDLHGAAVKFFSRIPAFCPACWDKLEFKYVAEGAKLAYVCSNCSRRFCAPIADLS